MSDGGSSGAGPGLSGPGAAGSGAGEPGAAGSDVAGADRAGRDRAGGPPARIHLALGFHDHQPIGNFPEVFEEHYERAYLPFLDTMDRHPRVPFSLHLTGPLLLWLGEHHPEYVARLRRLCAAGRLEMKGGGFYEPILTMIPDEDKVEQLQRLGRYLEEVVGVRPEGAWIAERVWEPHLARPLSEAGLHYAALDDSHFRGVGIEPYEALGYFVTEEGGRRFDLFPISKELRYLIPFQEPEATIRHLRELAEGWRERRLAGLLPPDAAPPLAVYDDDGEKFGGWPGTHAHVYGSRWLERFLTLLEDEAASGRLVLTTLGAFRRRHPPLGRVYLPTGSYAEMLEWSGGYYRNFLVRYEEANLLHKRMLHTSRGVSRAGGESDASGEPGRERRRALQLARDHVLRAQCNDAYWHGVFGGLYLPHLRHAAYASLIRAEALAGGPMRSPVEIVDVDLDGRDEVFLRSKDLTALVHPARGGSVVCLDHLPTAFALLDTLRRRREPEHAALEEYAAAAPEDEPAGAHAPSTIHEGVRMKEPGLERLLFVDRHPRAALLDHFYPADLALRALVEGTAREWGDFVQGPYRVEEAVDAAGDRGPRARLARAGTVAGRPVTVRKLITLDDGGASLEAAYTVLVGREHEADETRASTVDGVGGDETRTAVRFAPEIDLTLLAGWAHDRYVLVDGVRPAEAHLADAGVHPGASAVAMVDEASGIRVTAAWDAELLRDGAAEPPPEATLYRYGVVTVSLSEDGFERIYQGTCLLPSWTLPLEPGVELRARIRLEVEG